MSPEYKRQWRIKNAERLRKGAREYRLKNLERLREYDRKRNAEGRFPKRKELTNSALEEERAKDREWYQANREKVLARKRNIPPEQRERKRLYSSSYNKPYRILNRDILKEKQRINYEKNRLAISELQKERRKTWTKEKREKELARCRAHYVANHESRLKKMADQRAKNPNANKEYHANNRGKVRARRNAYYKKDPQFRMRTILARRLVKLLRKQRSMNTVELIGCTLVQVVKHLESQFRDDMSWANHGITGWHVDHIIPCSSFDLTDTEQQKKCFHYTNLQPLWWWENLAKGDKLIA